MSMNSAPPSWKLPVFIGSLVLVALSRNLYFFNRAKAEREAKARAVAAAEAQHKADQAAQEKKQAAAQQAREVKEGKAVQDAAAEHARFLARYLNAGPTRWWRRGDLNPRPKSTYQSRLHA